MFGQCVSEGFYVLLILTAWAYMVLKTNGVGSMNTYSMRDLICSHLFHLMLLQVLSVS